MKNLIYILFTFLTIGMVTTTFAQTTDLKLKDIYTIDSRENLERLLIENNFEMQKSTEGGKLGGSTIVDFTYGFNLGKKNGEDAASIWMSGAYLKDSNSLISWYFNDINYANANSFYNRIFREVKRKCTFYKIKSISPSISVSLYTCPKASFEGKLGFFVEDDTGYIIYASE